MKKDKTRKCVRCGRTQPRQFFELYSQPTIAVCADCRKAGRPVKE